jgi:hypothetical protein
MAIERTRSRCRRESSRWLQSRRAQGLSVGQPPIGTGSSRGLACCRAPKASTTARRPSHPADIRSSKLTVRMDFDSAARLRWELSGPPVVAGNTTHLHRSRAAQLDAWDGTSTQPSPD